MHHPLCSTPPHAASVKKRNSRSALFNSVAAESSCCRGPNIKISGAISFLCLLSVVLLLPLADAARLPESEEPHDDITFRDYDVDPSASLHHSGDGFSAAMARANMQPGSFVTDPNLLAGYPIFVPDTARDILAKLVSRRKANDKREVQQQPAAAPPPPGTLSSGQSQQQPQPAGAVLSSPAGTVVPPADPVEQPLLVPSGALDTAPSNASEPRPTDDPRFQQEQEMMSLLLQSSPELQSLYYNNLVNSGLASPYDVPSTFFRDLPAANPGKQEEEADRLAQIVLEPNPSSKIPGLTSQMLKAFLTSSGLKRLLGEGSDVPIDPTGLSPVAPFATIGSRLIPASIPLASMDFAGANPTFNPQQVPSAVQNLLDDSAQLGELGKILGVSNA